MNQAIPNKRNAIVEHQKIAGYLLSSHHPVGRNKARVFARCGYDSGSIDRLIVELKRIIAEGQLEEVIESPYGSKYIIDGTLRCSRGAALEIRTIWIVETQSRFPRFVTAYPV